MYDRCICVHVCMYGTSCIHTAVRASTYTHARVLRYTGVCCCCRFLLLYSIARVYICICTCVCVCGRWKKLRRAGCDPRRRHKVDDKADYDDYYYYYYYYIIIINIIIIGGPRSFCISI